MLGTQSRLSLALAAVAAAGINVEQASTEFDAAQRKLASASGEYDRAVKELTRAVKEAEVSAVNTASTPRRSATVIDLGDGQKGILLAIDTESGLAGDVPEDLKPLVDRALAQVRSAFGGGAFRTH